MPVSFSCPSCGAPGRVDESFAGRQVRCNQCQHRFTIPALGEEAPDGYALDAPAPSAIVPEAGPSRMESVYAPTPGDESGGSQRRKPPRRPSSQPRRKRPGREGPETNGRPRLIWGVGVAAVVLILIALLAPNGLVIAGSTLAIVGSLMVFVGWAAGLYGAYSEDFLYAFLYVVIPFYAAYYLVTRWDDLWRWFACSTAGVVLVTIGTRMLQSAGVEG